VHERLEGSDRGGVQTVTVEVLLILHRESHGMHLQATPGVGQGRLTKFEKQMEMGE